jgi:ribosome recycling factor
MQKSLSYLTEQLDAIRAGFISPAATTFIVDSIRVNNQPISHIATTIRDQNRITVIPWDSSLLQEIDSTLKKHGFNSYIFSKTSVVVSTSSLVTAEEVEKVRSRIKNLGEETKIAIRKIRQKARKIEGKEKDKEIQSITDDFIKSVDVLVENKVKTL